MKINIISKAIVALFVVYGSSSAIAGLGQAAPAKGSISGIVRRNNVQNPNERVFAGIDSTAAEQPQGTITGIPADQRDMSGDTMYALPYEEKSAVSDRSTKPASVDEPAYKQGRRRRGTMYAS